MAAPHAARQVSAVGSHVVLALIGEGGMDEVYRARSTTLDREVAIEPLPEAVAGDPERLALGAPGGIE